jgi:hypothetical protein
MIKILLQIFGTRQFAAGTRRGFLFQPLTITIAAPYN